MRRFAPLAVLALAVVFSAWAAWSGIRSSDERGTRTTGDRPVFGLEGTSTRATPRAERPTGGRSIRIPSKSATRTLKCGGGRNIVVAGFDDLVARDCEVVTRQLSRDPYRNTGAQHETQVEPSSFSHGLKIVTAFQTGRFSDGGGAANIGFASSPDGGVTWTSGFLPGVSIFAAPAGNFSRVSDPVVTYDARHRTWLVASLAESGRELDLLVSRSRDGITWRPPTIAARSEGDGIDKEWVTCDNWRGSRFYGRCYIAYVDFESNDIKLRRSTDGGQTWSAPARWPVVTRTVVNGVQPLVRQNGTLIVAFTIFDRYGNPDGIATIRSTDGAVSFGGFDRIAEVAGLDLQHVRAAPLPSGAVDAAGTIWLTWSDCRFVEDCASSSIVVIRSRDGRSWSKPAPVPVGGGARFDVDRFVPAIAVSGSGGSARVAITYYSMRQPTGCAYSCAGDINAWLSASHNGARSWRPPQRLNPKPIRFRWLATTGGSRFLGDYVGISFVRGRAIPVVSLASRPSGGYLRQAIFATTRIAQ